MAAPAATAAERFPRVRQSVLANFDACPLSARFDIEHRSHWTSAAAARGTLTHRVIAACLNHMVEHDQPEIPVEVAMDIFDEVLRQSELPVAADDQLDETVVALPLREVASSRVTVKTWAANYSVDVRDIAGVEMRLDTTLTYPGENGELVERVFTTKPDLILIKEGGTLGIVNDWKDTWGIPGERGLDADGDDDGEGGSFGDNISDDGYFQMRAGALVAFRRWPRLQRIIFREVYPRYLGGTSKDRRGRPINPVRQATIDRYVLPELEAEFSALIQRFDRAVESGEWAPQPGAHCAFCPRPEACTILPAARVEGRITSGEEAEKVAGLLVVLDAVRGQVTRSLRAWSKEYGDVPLRGGKTPKVYGPVVRTRTRKPDPEQVLAHVRRGGNPADLYVTEEYVRFCVHTPEERHPHAVEASREAERLAGGGGQIG